MRVSDPRHSRGQSSRGLGASAREPALGDERSVAEIVWRGGRLSRTDEEAARTLVIIYFGALHQVLDNVARHVKPVEEIEIE